MHANKREFIYKPAVWYSAFFKPGIGQPAVLHVNVVEPLRLTIIL
jgi:hypothetical protein